MNAYAKCNIDHRYFHIPRDLLREQEQEHQQGHRKQRERDKHQCDNVNAELKSGHVRGELNHIGCETGVQKTERWVYSVDLSEYDNVPAVRLALKSSPFRKSSAFRRENLIVGLMAIVWEAVSARSQKLDRSR